MRRFAVYRLMVVTDSIDIKEYMLAYDAWIQNGFKVPHFRTSKETLIEGLQKHHIDAIAVELKSEDEKNKIFSFLYQSYPLIPVFKISDSKKYQGLIFDRLRKSLDKINADYSDDNFTYDQKFDAVRNRWISKYLRGKLQDYQEFEEKNQIFRANLNLNSPCSLAELSIPGRDDFLLSEWRYGADRLEVALRNFFSPDTLQANICIAVTEKGICRVLLSHKDIVSKQETEQIADFNNFLESAINEIEDFLSLEVKIDTILSFQNHKECFQYLNTH